MLLGGAFSSSVLVLHLQMERPEGPGTSKIPQRIGSGAGDPACVLASVHTGPRGGGGGPGLPLELPCRAGLFCTAWPQGL